MSVADVFSQIIFPLQFIFRSMSFLPLIHFLLQQSFFCFVKFFFTSPFSFWLWKDRSSYAKVYLTQCVYMALGVISSLSYLNVSFCFRFQWRKKKIFFIHEKNNDSIILIQTQRCRAAPLEVRNCSTLLNIHLDEKEDRERGEGIVKRAEQRYSPIFILNVSFAWLNVIYCHW